MKRQLFFLFSLKIYFIYVYIEHYNTASTRAAVFSSYHDGSRRCLIKAHHLDFPRKRSKKKFLFKSSLLLFWGLLPLECLCSYINTYEFVYICCCCWYNVMDDSHVKYFKRKNHYMHVSEYHHHINGCLCSYWWNFIIFLSAYTKNPPKHKHTQFCLKSICEI